MLSMLSLSSKFNLMYENLSVMFEYFCRDDFVPVIVTLAPAVK